MKHTSNTAQNQWEVFWFYLQGMWKYTLIGFMCVLCIRFFLVIPGRINGTSMEDTYTDNQFFLVNKVSYLILSPERFDIVQLVSELDNSTRIVKRIIGLPGETIQIKQGKVFLVTETGIEEIQVPHITNTQRLYTIMPQQVGVYQITIPENEYFVLGDNRRESTDSRHFGTVHRIHIIGRLFRTHE